MTDEQPTPPRIEPGDKFTVEYGGKTAVVVALAGRKERELAKQIAAIAELENIGGAETFKIFELTYEAIKLAMPDATEDELDLLDAKSMMEICGKCLGKQALSDEDKKKLESQP